MAGSSSRSGPTHQWRRNRDFEPVVETYPDDHNSGSCDPPSRRDHRNDLFPKGLPTKRKRSTSPERPSHHHKSSRRRSINKEASGPREHFRNEDPTVSQHRNHREKGTTKHSNPPRTDRERSSIERHGNRSSSLSGKHRSQDSRSVDRTGRQFESTRERSSQRSPRSYRRHSSQTRRSSPRQYESRERRADKSPVRLSRRRSPVHWDRSRSPRSEATKAEKRRSRGSPSSRHQPARSPSLHKSTRKRSRSPTRHRRTERSARDPRRYSPERSRKRSRSYSPNRRHHRSEKLAERLARDDMHQSYHGHGNRGGTHRGRGGYGYGSQHGSPYNHFPPPHSPYGSNHSWTGQYHYPQQGSPVHPGYPPQVSPYHHTGYPPPASPGGYFPPVPPPNPYAVPSIAQTPPLYHKSSYESVHRGRTWDSGQAKPRDDRRHSSTSTASNTPSRGGRATFTNLSWTPATGSRGGVQLPPRARKSLGKDEEEDNPFRPSKELQAEDQTVKDKRDDKEKKEAQFADSGKVKFALKSKSSQPPATSALDLSVKRPAKYESEKPKVVKKKERSVLPIDYATSDSVYYRRPGNESVIGSGTYGKVFRAIHVYTGEKVALKKIRMEGERDGFPVTAIREVKLLQSLNSPHIVKLQEVMVEKNDCYMVFEYLSHDLTGLLNHPTFQLNNAHKKHLAQQLFEGLNYLHTRGVLHRDIKAANILISNSGQLKLADFGLARFYAKRRQVDYTNRVITIWYRSPELLLGETQYGPAVDIWSAACVLVEIFTKHAIFPGDGGEINQLDRIYSVLGTPTRAEWPEIVDLAWFELLRPAERVASTFAEKYHDRVSEQAFDLLDSMFRFDPKQRPTAMQVLEHPYFKQELPAPLQTLELKSLEGDWHEFESKALRKEREKLDREARKAREAEERDKRKRAPASPQSIALESQGASVVNGDAKDNSVSSTQSVEREAKRARMMTDTPVPPPPPPPPAAMDPVPDVNPTEVQIENDEQGYKSDESEILSVGAIE